MEELTKFIRTQRILQIAPAAGDPWIANVYMGAEGPTRIYFIGSEETRYGQQLRTDEKLAFATAWHDTDDHSNRKGIQGVGTCTIATDEDDLKKGVMLHNRNYPEFAERITVEWVKANTTGSHVWIITPSFIKFWDDEAYGDDEYAEFNF